METTSSTAFAPGRLSAKIIALDVAERVFLVTLFACFVRNMLMSATAQVNPITILLVVSESLPVILVCLRGPSATMSMRPSDWFLGFAATSAPLLATPSNTAAPLVPLALCLVLMLSGMVLQTAAKIFLGRSFGVIAANRGVKISGPYRFVRHPMYAGYVMTHLAYLLSGPSLHNFVIYATALGLQLIRLDREEQLLGKDASYRAYSGEVRHRLIPGLY